MDEQDVKPEDGEPRAGEPTEGPEPEEPKGFDFAACCGPMMKEMMQSCPCGAMMKRHWLAAFVIFSLVVLAFLISQVGGILGIIAFIRTLG